MLEGKSGTFDQVRCLRTIVSAALVCLLFLSSYAPFASGQTCTFGSNVILDGSFESGFDWDPPWTIQTSDLFGSSICDTSICTDIDGNVLGAGPRTGTNWLLYGAFGSPGAAEDSQTGQTITVPTNSIVTLRFFMRVSAVAAPFTDTVTIELDPLVEGDPGTPVLNGTFTEPGVAEGTYTERVVNFLLTAGTHTIQFHYSSPDALAEFNIDDITLNVCAVTAARASISGRVLSASGRGLANASVTLTDQLGVRQTVNTTTFGFYKFDDVLVGESYVLQPVMGQFTFSPQVITLDGDLEGVNFVVGR